LPSSNSCYWDEKISRTKARDEKHARALVQLGWRVLVLWECELGDEAKLWARIEGFLQARGGQLSAPSAS
jgi:DNA mismatch endonuclease (patch repair protein)